MKVPPPIVLVGFVISNITVWSTKAATVEKKAKEILDGLRHDFDMNVQFQLKKLGINHDRVGSSNNTKCFGPLGCLDITEDWYGLSRPVNSMPDERHVINTQFLLWTRDTRSQLEVLNSSEFQSIKSSNFEPDKETKMIIHGFMDTGYVPWVEEMAMGLLDVGDYNVVAVDWGGGSAGLYSQAAANTRLVGLEVAYLIDVLVTDIGCGVESFHLIGHSLGSHIAGYAGDKVQQQLGGSKLGRISGLDPAEPLFQFMPSFVRLDPDDAHFVDVIHTDAKSILMLGYGMEQPVGHVDFYPNGGTDQPGCSLLDLPVDLTSVVEPDKTADSVGRHLVACSHMRAVQLFIESLQVNKTCQLVGQKCSSYKEYKMGLCYSCGPSGKDCAPMGYRAIEYKEIVDREGLNNVKMYLDTGKSPSNFCRYHYVLHLDLADPPPAEKWVQGFLTISLYGSNKEILDLDLSPDESIRLDHGSNRSFLLSFTRDLGDINIVSITWTYDHEIDPLNLTKVCFLLCSDHLYVRSVTVQGASTNSPNRSTEICSESSVADISSGESKLFYKRCGTS